MKNKFNKIFTTFIFIISMFAFSSCNINWFNDLMEDMYNQAALRHWQIKVFFEEELNPECTLTVDDSKIISKPVHPNSRPISEEDLFLSQTQVPDIEREKLHICFETEESFSTWFENATFTITLKTENDNIYEGQIFIKEAIDWGAYQKGELTNTNNPNDKIICYFAYIYSQSI